MRIEINEDKTIVFLYKYQLSFNDIEKVNKEIKNIFVKLIKVYKLNLQGYLKVYIYCNKIYGYVLEIESLYTDSDFEIETIDLRLVIYDNCDFYLKTDDYSLIEKLDNVYHDGISFYVNLNQLDKLINFIEHGDIVYNFDKNKYKLL